MLVTGIDADVSLPLSRAFNGRVNSSTFVLPSGPVKIRVTLIGVRPWAKSAPFDSGDQGERWNPAQHQDTVNYLLHGASREPAVRPPNENLSSLSRPLRLSRAERDKEKL
jgi:hypothetical protein